MKGYIFPGQGAQFPGMGKDLYEKSIQAKEMFEHANMILGFSITDIMFGEDIEALKQTKVTQPAIFLHSVILAKCLGDSFKPAMVAGHSLGELSALVAAHYISFEDGLKLVDIRAKAMQYACEKNPSTMAAILGLEDQIVEKVCSEIQEIVVPANYNCPGQLVISGGVKAIENACEALKEKGAKTVTAYITHPVLSGNAIEKINKSTLDQLVVTDTIPLSKQAEDCKKIRIMSLAPTLAEAIRRINKEESISAMMR